MRKSFLVLSLPIILATVACGSSTTSSNPANTSTAKSAAVTQKAKPTIDPKVAYVNELNDLNIKNELKVIAEYGPTIKSLDETNQNDVQQLQDFDKSTITDYKSTLSKLNSMSVPATYKTFHKNLTQSINDFITVMQEMELHLKTKGDTTHFAKATAYYIESTDDIMKVAKLLPYGQLK